MPAAISIRFLYGLLRVFLCSMEFPYRAKVSVGVEKEIVEGFSRTLFHSICIHAYMKGDAGLECNGGENFRHFAR